MVAAEAKVCARGFVNKVGSCLVETRWAFQSKIGQRISREKVGRVVYGLYFDHPERIIADPGYL